MSTYHPPLTRAERAERHLALAAREASIAKHADKRSQAVEDLYDLLGIDKVKHDPKEKKRLKELISRVEALLDSRESDSPAPARALQAHDGPVPEGQGHGADGTDLFVTADHAESHESFGAGPESAGWNQ